METFHVKGHEPWKPRRAENDSPPFKGKGYKRETSKDTQIGKKGKPPLSGREGGSRERKEGEDCVSAASSAAPREASASERKSPIPGGGSSWFVLLTEEKNEQERPYGNPVKAGNDIVPFRK